MKSERLIGIFYGMRATFFRDVPGWTSYFYFYSYLKTIFENRLFLDWKRENARTYLLSFLAGGFAGQISWLICFPFDVLKCHIQCYSLHEPMLNTFKHLYNTYGVKFFYKGLSAWLCNAFPVNGVMFVVYEQTVNFLNTYSLAE